jgi:hypothetical protein
MDAFSVKIFWQLRYPAFIPETQALHIFTCWMFQLGNWVKTFPPRNVRVAEFVNIFVNVPRGRKSVS